MCRRSPILYYQWTLQQNVSISPYCILPTQTFITPSRNTGSISFFSSSDRQQSHHLLGCHATDINSSFDSFFKCFTFFKFRMSSQKSDMNNSTRIIKIIIVKVNAIRICIKNTHFLIIKYNITKIFIKIEYIFICIKGSKKLFNHFTCNKPVGNKI